MSVLAERLTSQLLAGEPARDAVVVAERLLATQAQDLRGARLAIRARTRGLTGRDLDRALTEDRSLLITWLNRGTLHLVRRDDYPWLQALTTPPLHAGNARRLEQTGVTPRLARKGADVIVRALADEGPLTRNQLAERVAAAGVPTKNQALVHLLMRTSLEGLTVRGPMVGVHQAFVLVSDWLGPQPTVDRDHALAELARRYLVGHGPADDRDLAKWAGVPLRDARAGLTSISAELDERPDGLVELTRRPAAADVPPPKLLGVYEPLLLGWVSREPVLGRHLRRVTVEGLFRPFAIAGGRAVATWRLQGGEVALEPFGRLPRDVRLALDADAQDVLRFLTADSQQPVTLSLS
jgi:Winged helix DNA-binding domain